LLATFTPRPLNLSNPASVGYKSAVSAAAHYRQLVRLGRAEFLTAAAPAALVRYRGGEDDEDIVSTVTIEETVEDATLPMTRPPLAAGEVDIEVYPLVKKPGASFPDRITIGRTGNNDVVIADHSISRLHAYVRKVTTGWIVADAGSKNGSSLRGAKLEARKEQLIASRAVLRLGDVDLTFYLAVELYGVLGGT
jgi:hypothetical protein